ncbi:MAG: biotin/lipoyl-containing protein [Bacteroidota bacterium]
MPNSSFLVQTRVGDRTLTIERDGDTVTVDGEPVDVRVSHLGDQTILLVLDGTPTVVTVESTPEGGIATVRGRRIEVGVKTETDLLLERFGMNAGDSAADREVRAPMPGLVLRVLVEPGETVEPGQGVVVLEAMKMENELKAPASGTVAAVHAVAGAAVGKNDLLVELGE